MMHLSECGYDLIIIIIIIIIIIVIIVIITIFVCDNSSNIITSSE